MCLERKDNLLCSFQEIKTDLNENYSRMFKKTPHYRFSLARVKTLITVVVAAVLVGIVIIVSIKSWWLQHMSKCA